MARVILIALLTVLYIVAGIPSWLSSTESPYLLRAGLYSFFHANVFHLAVNCLAIWSVFNPKRKNILRNFFAALVIAVIVYPLTFRPVIGISNVLYAILGLRTPSFRSAWWRDPSVILFLAITFGMVLIPSIAGTTHIAAFILGTAVSRIKARSL